MGNQDKYVSDAEQREWRKVTLLAVSSCFFLWICLLVDYIRSIPRFSRSCRVQPGIAVAGYGHDPPRVPSLIISQSGGRQS